MRAGGQNRCLRGVMYAGVVWSQRNGSILDSLGFTIFIFSLLFCVTYFFAKFPSLLSPNGRKFCDITDYANSTASRSWAVASV